MTILPPRHVGDPEKAAVADATVGDAIGGPAKAPPDAVVLVVEDEPDLRMVLADVLMDLGYGVLQAADGRGGLQIVQSAARIDMLLTDIGLPGGMNGRQLADLARQHRPGLKVLFVTGQANTAALGGHLDAGMQAMTKPFTMCALADKVQNVIRANMTGV